MDIYAVTGKPVVHSLSPEIFNHAFKNEAINAVYTRLAAQSALEALEMARKIGLRGLNVTAPFKEDMVDLVAHLDAEALIIGAVNGVTFSNDRTFGFNTDGLAVGEAFKLHDIELKGKKALVLGAGGAARAATYALLKGGADVTVVNRTFSRAVALGRRFGCRTKPLSRISTVLESAEIIVSTVSSNDLLIDPERLAPGQVVLDANYRDSKLSSIAGEKGCRLISGVDWLICQAAAAFQIFTGRTVTFQNLKQALESSASAKRKASIISLIGMMGSGKSSVGRRLASELKLEFVDTDEAIETETNARIPEIFEARGEAYFRRLEGRTIAGLIRGSRNAVLALGGGAVSIPENRERLKSRSLVIWLWADSEEILRRITASGRPLLRADDLPARLKEILSARLDDYARTSDLIVNANPPLEEVTRKIVDEIR